MHLHQETYIHLQRFVPVGDNLGATFVGMQTNGWIGKGAVAEVDLGQCYYSIYTILTASLFPSSFSGSG